MTVQPHEPVRYAYGYKGAIPAETYCALQYDLTGRILHGLGDEGRYACYVTLANGQRIIVRALSEERKAARRHERILDTYSPFSAFYKATGSQRREG